MKAGILAVLIICFTMCFGLLAVLIAHAEEPKPTVQELRTQTQQLVSETFQIVGRLQMIDSTMDFLFKQKQAYKARRGVVDQSMKVLTKQLNDIKAAEEKAVIGDGGTGTTDRLPLHDDETKAAE